jgi:hypothetical protein
MACFGAAQFRERFLSVPHHTPQTLHMCIVDNSVDKLAKMRRRDARFRSTKTLFLKRLRVCQDLPRQQQAKFFRSAYRRRAPTTASNYCLQLMGDYILRSREDRIVANTNTTAP